jgi:hypothetical protein
MTANLAEILTPEGHVFKPAGVISVGDLLEVLAKCFGRSNISPQTIMAFSDLFGQPRTSPIVAAAFSEFLTICNLVDTYPLVNPAPRSISSERFTCWDQYRNERYANKGARIDYVFVDKKLERAVRLVETADESGDTSLQTSAFQLPPLAISPDRYRSLQAATAEGRWKPVPFAGGGIDSDHSSVGARDFEFQFTNPPQTGIVYTAPLYSDHVATSCVLDMTQFPTDGITDRSDESMSQFWKSAMADALVEPPVTHSLKDMFAKLERHRGELASPPEPEIVDLVHSDSDRESCKRKRIE